jgi:hypothetical protein
MFLAGMVAANTDCRKELLRGHIYFTLGAIDQRYVDAFNARRGIGATRRERLARSSSAPGSASLQFP